MTSMSQSSLITEARNLIWPAQNSMGHGWHNPIFNREFLCAFRECIALAGQDGTTLESEYVKKR